MELTLGTAQFGLRYGVAGRATAVPEYEVRAILARAAALGVRVLDTAAAYGDIEARLARLAHGQDFGIVTKLPPKPEGLRPADVDAWADASLRTTHDRLGNALRALMFHRAEDLLDEGAEQLWQRCAAWAARHGCKLGVSCYDPATLSRIQQRFPIMIAQLPGNALDQRLRTEAVAGASPTEIHVRSAFLQGLLLMPQAAAAERVPQAAAALARWHGWLRDHALDPLQAALGLVKALPGVSHCVVGVDDEAQLEAIAAAWHATPALHADALAVTDLDVIDPRRWPART